jgi:hypothetical protein
VNLNSVAEGNYSTLGFLSASCCIGLRLGRAKTSDTKTVEPRKGFSGYEVLV